MSTEKQIHQNASQVKTGSGNEVLVEQIPHVTGQQSPFTLEQIKLPAGFQQIGVRAVQLAQKKLEL